LFVPRLDPTRNPRSTERFPCENCPCGCSSAEFCWDKCCCHNDQEKLAWAKANDVQPPSFLLRRIAQQTALNSDAKAGEAAKACCCCSSGSSESKVDGGKACSTAKSATEQDDEKSSTRAVVMWKSAQCRGIGLLWSQLGPTLARPMLLAETNEPPLIARLMPHDLRYDSVLLCPDPPIP